MAKRMFSFLLVLLMLLGIAPEIRIDENGWADVALVHNPLLSTEAYAAEISSGSGTWISGKLTYTWASQSSGTTGNGAAGTVSSSNGTLTVTATNSKYVSDSCNGDTQAEPTTTTVTVTNASSYPLKITTLTTGGSAQVAGVSQEQTIASGATFTVSVTAPAKNTSTMVSGTVTIAVEEQTSVSITLASSPYVSYTVNGTTVAQNGSDQTFTTNVGTNISLPSVTAPSGYEFKGWRVGNSIVTGSSFMADSAYTVFPVIVTSGTVTTGANFKVGSNTYTFWEEAVTAAVSGGGKVIVNATEVTLPNSVENNLLPPAGGTYVKPASGGGVEYIVPGGVTLQLPYDTTATLHTTTPAYGYKAHVTPSPFRTLTVPNGAKITVNGAVSVDSYVSSYGTGSGSWNGTPSGPHGKIVMKSGSEMVFNAGANLYCYGYINGDGQITINSGATVYELFQDRAWRGGSATSDMAGNSQKVFPLPMYYIQNVEAPMRLYKGATEYVWTVACASSSAFASNQIEFIGSNGMFTLTGGSGDYITKRYHANVDRLEVAAHGNMQLNNLNVSIGGLPLIGTISIDSADYVLPINNMQITVETGTTSIASSQTYGVAFLPGSKLTVNEGATFSVNAPTYFYDVSEWGLYGTNGAAYVPVGYSTANGATTIRSADNLEDAEMDVNGTVTVSNELYTTASGAHITSSSGTGVINFTTDCATSTVTTYQATYNSSSKNMDYHAINCNNAWLQNGDESYSKTVSTGKSTWKYDKPGEHWYRFLVDFKYNNNLIERGYYCENNDTVTYDASWLTDLGATASNGTAAIDGTNVNVTGVTADSTVTLTGTPAEYKPTFVLNEKEYSHYHLFSGAEITDTTTINGETYYIVDQASSALAVGTAYVAPTDAEMGVTAANHNTITWNMSGISATSGDPYRGTVPAGGTAGGPVYIYGFYTGVVAHNSWNDQYYDTLLGAFEVLPQDVSATITLLADCGTFEEESGTVAYTAYTANNITLDLNGHHATGRIVNSGTFTLELNGGTLDYHTGATAAAATYKGVAAVINSGTMTIQDTTGGGKITTDAISNTAGTDGSAVIRNNAGATLTVTGKDAEHLLPLENTQNVNGNNYGIFNLGTITALTNVDISTANSGTCGYNIYNIDTGTITSISGGHMFAYSGYSIFNYGGKITTIDGLSIDGRYGVNNRNKRGSNTIANGYNIAYYGEIGTITNVNFEVGQYAIYNGGKITTMSNSTFIAHPDSAQVDTRGNGTTASEGNVQCYTVYNSATWWYDTNVWKRVDSSSGGYTRTDYYKEEEQYRPTIGQIVDCEIYAENTSTSASHGYTLYNAGVIGTIGGTTNIKAYKHPDNAKISTSSYALLNAGGGIIKSIEGAVNISATAAYAVTNDSPFTTQINYTYGNKVGGNITYQKNTYGQPATIQSITASGTWSVGSYYALLNNGYIQSINAPNLTLTGNYNVLYNSTGGSNSTYEITKKYTDPATASTEYERDTHYVKNLEKGSTIGTINGITVTGKGSKSYYPFNNQGNIGTVSNVTVNFAEGATANTSYYVAFLNGDSRYAEYTETIQTNRTAETDPLLTVSAGIVTRYDRNYTYATPTIDVIKNLTVNSITAYALRNAGHIGELKNSTITGTQYALHNSASGPYTERQTLQYYSGTAIFATDKYTSEYNKHYTRDPASIDLIDNCTITTPANTYAMFNSGHVGTIKNSTLQAGTTTAKAYALWNGGSSTIVGTEREYTLNLEDYFYVTANGKTACTAYWATNGETKVVTYDYDAPTIDLIGEGNTFKATTTVIANTGIITAIDSGEGELTTVTGSAAKGSTIYNYSACLDARTTTTPYTAAASASASGTAGTAVNDDTLLSGGRIGTIKNVYINANGYGILNGDATTGKTPTIGEIGEGTEIYAHCTTAGYHAIYNQANAKVTGITGGIYTTTKATTNAYKNNNTDPALATLISGGNYKGMSATRANAIYEPDNTSRQTYGTAEAPKVLSSTSHSVNFNNGTTVAAGTGYYYICDPVAKIGTSSYYSSLAAAVEAAQNGDTVTMIANEALPALVAIEGKNITLDLNGHTVSRSTDSALQVKGTGALTLKDDSDSQTGEVQAANAKVGISDAVVVLEGGSFTLESGTVKSNTYGISSLGTVTVTGGTVRGDAGALYKADDSSGRFTVSGGWFSHAVNSNYCATGYRPVTDATHDPQYTVSNLYTVIWKNGDTTLETDENVAYDTTPTYNGATPTKAGHTFQGWSTDGTTVLESLPAVSANATYIAVFTPNTATGTITYSLVTGSASPVEENVSFAYSYTDTLSDPVYTYYEFIGWTYQDSEGTMHENVSSEDMQAVLRNYFLEKGDATIHLTANFKRQEYTVKVYSYIPDVDETPVMEKESPTRYIGRSTQVSAPASFKEENETYNFQYWMIGTNADFETGYERYDDRVTVFFPTEPGAYNAIAYYSTDAPGTATGDGISFRIVNETTEKVGDSWRAVVTVELIGPKGGYTMSKIGLKYHVGESISDVSSIKNTETFNTSDSLTQAVNAGTSIGGTATFRIPFTSNNHVYAYAIATYGLSGSTESDHTAVKNTNNIPYDTIS